MSRARYWRHSSADTHGHLLTVEHAFFGQSVTWHSRRNSTRTDEERHAIAHQILIDMGMIFCLRCTRGWLDEKLDAEAERLGISVVRIGEASLNVCPYCTLMERVFMLLRQRLTNLRARRLDVVSAEEA